MGRARFMTPSSSQNPRDEFANVFFVIGGKISDTIFRPLTVSFSDLDINQAGGGGGKSLRQRK